MNNPETILSRAQALTESKDYSKARALLMSLLPSELSPEDRANRAALLVHCLHSTGADELARQTLDAELFATPESLDLWMLSSHLYDEQNNLQEVERALQGAVRNCNVPDAGLALASFLSREHRDADALACYEKMLLQWPEHPDVLFEYACLQERLDTPEDAQKTWELLCQTSPEDTEAWLRYAIALSDSGDMEAARKAFDTARQLEPDNIVIWYNRAVAESRAENRLGVRLCAESLQRLDPNSPRTHIVSAWATEERRTSRKHAMQAINAALSDDVEDEDADMFLCASLAHLRDLNLLEDFDKSFIQALRAEKAGPETLALHREYNGATLKKPRVFRFSLALPDSFRDESQPNKFPIRHLDVITTSSERALALAAQLEALAGLEGLPLVGPIEKEVAPKEEKEGVSYRSQPCYHEELPK